MVARIPLLALAFAGIGLALLVSPDAWLATVGFDPPEAREALRWCGFFLIGMAPLKARADAWDLDGRQRWAVASALLLALVAVTRHQLLILVLLGVVTASLASIGMLVATAAYERFVEKLNTE